MIWPFKRQTETRRDADYTDSVVSLIQSTATGVQSGDISKVAAFQTAANLYASCFASATVEGERSDALTPAIMACIAREMATKGDCVFVIRVTNGKIRLWTCATWDVRGMTPDPTEWQYRCDLHGPDGSRVSTIPAAGIVHCRYSIDPSRPWQGVGPIARASATGKLAAGVEQTLQQETTGASGYFLPIPDDADDVKAAIRTAMQSSKGRTTPLPTTAGGMGDRMGAPKKDYESTRYGFNPPAHLKDFRLCPDVLAAMGVPPGLATADGDGTGQRESYRRFVIASIEPMARIIETELSDKLETRITLSFGALAAADIASRTRSLKQLVEAGLTPEEARGIVRI